MIKCIDVVMSSGPSPFYPLGITILALACGVAVYTVCVIFAGGDQVLQHH